jgi:hypothetical protein
LGIERGVHKAKSAHYAHNALINGFASLIEERSAKHPERGLPADLLADIARRWRNASDEFRVVFLSNIKNTKGTICEGRIGYHGLIHADWETTVVIAFVAISVTRLKAQVTVRVEHSFSFHSLARFYERTGKCEDADVKGAMSTALAFNPADCRLGEGDCPIRC